LRIFFVSFAVSVRVVFVGKVDDDFPFSVGVDSSLGPTVKDVRGTNVSASLVVVFGVGVAPDKKK
jgi:hypothetical protein